MKARVLHILCLSLLLPHMAGRATYASSTPESMDSMRAILDQTKEMKLKFSDGYTGHEIRKFSKMSFSEFFSHLTHPLPNSEIDIVGNDQFDIASSCKKTKSTGRKSLFDCTITVGSYEDPNSFSDAALFTSKTLIRFKVEATEDHHGNIKRTLASPTIQISQIR